MRFKTTSQRLHEMVSASRVQTLTPIVAVAITALIGGAYLFSSRAAGPSVAAEAELGTRSGNVSTVADTTASAGQAVRFGSSNDLPSDLQAWSDPATWDGSVPAPGSNVTIPAGKKVLMDYDGYAAARLASLTIEGELYFPDRPVVFRVSSIIVAGQLHVGSENYPVQSKIEIVLDVIKTDPTYTFPVSEINGNAPAGTTTFGVGNGVLAVKRGGRLELHGAPVTRTWTRLAQTANAGSTSITLQESVAGQWKTGDKIVLAPSGLKPLEYDESTITAIAADGKTITLAAPLAYKHAAVVTSLTSGAETRTIEERAEVGLLSHNLVLRGPDNAPATRHGGHVIGFYQSTQRISGAEFRYLGQIGILGKYPMHFHHTTDGSGSRIEGNSIWGSFNRVLAIHNTNSITFHNNVAHDTFGHAVMTEIATEQNNILTRNLVMTVRRAPDGQRLLAPGFNGAARIGPGNGHSDDTPAAFWITHPNNTLTDNATAGAEGTGIWYDLGPTEFGDNLNPESRRAPFGTFDRNVAHSNQDSPLYRPGNGDQRNFQSVNGIWIAGYEGSGDSWDNPVEINDNVAWKNWFIGFWADGPLIANGVRSANNGVASLNGFTVSRKAALWMYTGNTDMSDTSPDGELDHFSSLLRWYAVQSDYDDTWLANFSPLGLPANAKRISAIDGGVFENNGTPRLRNTRFFNENASGTKSHRIKFENTGIEGQYAQDMDGSVVGQPAVIVDNSQLNSTAAAVDYYPGDLTAGGRSWGKVLPGAKHMRMYDVQPAASPWTIVRESDGRSVTLESGNRRHSMLAGQRYRYTTTAPVSSLEINGLNMDRPGYNEFVFDWAPTTAPKVQKWVYFWMAPLNATQASSLSDLSTGKDYYWDQSAKKLYLRLNTTGSEPPIPTSATGFQNNVSSFERFEVNQ